MLLIILLKRNIFRVKKKYYYLHIETQSRLKKTKQNICTSVNFRRNIIIIISSRSSINSSIGQDQSILARRKYLVLINKKNWRHYVMDLAMPALKESEKQEKRQGTEKIVEGYTNQSCSSWNIPPETGKKTANRLEIR